MSRTADHSIQGYLYQFNKTLSEILSARDDAEIKIEGIIEDLEIHTLAQIVAIQCKYHESQTAFTLSTIYKPLLQMMEHFEANPSLNVDYVLFAHFPNPPENFLIDKVHLEEAVNSDNQSLQKYCLPLRSKASYEDFLKRFNLQFGDAYDNLVDGVKNSLTILGFTEVDELVYPNAIQIIAELSIKHNDLERTISRKFFLAELRRIKSTAISKWTLGLKTKKQILAAKKAQLQYNLSKNIRERYFLIHPDSLSDFDDQIITFICDVLQKYHFKLLHTGTPVFCLNVSQVVFDDLQVRLFRKNVKCITGYIANVFDVSHFFKIPLTVRQPDAKINREFDIRILRWENHETDLLTQKPDDLFMLGTNLCHGLNTQDVNLEILDAETFGQLAFIFGLSKTYE